MDLFPTLSEVAGSPLPTDRVYDGESLLPLLDGEVLKRGPNEAFYYYNCENLQAVRRGDWKLHLPRKMEQIPFWDRNKGFCKLTQPVLYNLRTDQGESQDVAGANPDLVRQMLGLAQEMRKELGEYMQRGKAQRPTGSISPGAPVISHEKDWGKVPTAVVEGLNKERTKRHPDWGAKRGKEKKRKAGR